MSRLVAVSVLLSTNSVIYSEKICPLSANFNHVFKVFQGLFFASPYSKKMCWGRGWVINYYCESLFINHCTHELSMEHYEFTLNLKLTSFLQPLGKDGANVNNAF